jgi:hypothetical protein
MTPIPAFRTSIMPSATLISELGSNKLAVLHDSRTSVLYTLEIVIGRACFHDATLAGATAAAGPLVPAPSDS